MSATVSAKSPSLRSASGVSKVYEASACMRHPKSRSRGRLGTPAEVVLRLLILKHIRNWSYGVLEREVRANLVYRDFTRLGGAKTPDAKTMERWGRRDQTDPHQDGDRGTEPWLDRRPPHARGHHGGGDLHPPSDRFRACWETARGCSFAP